MAICVGRHLICFNHYGIFINAGPPRAVELETQPATMDDIHAAWTATRMLTAPQLLKQCVISYERCVGMRLRKCGNICAYLPVGSGTLAPGQPAGAQPKPILVRAPPKPICTCCSRSRPTVSISALVVHQLCSCPGGREKRVSIRSAHAFRAHSPGWPRFKVLQQIDSFIPSLGHRPCQFQKHGFL